MGHADIESIMSEEPINRHPVDVVLSNCSIEVIKKGILPFGLWENAESRADKKILLQPVSVRINGGSLFAILGGSGSGKTSLLNVIAQRYDTSNTIVGGDGVTFCKPNWRGKSCKVGYVTQADYLLPYLTVTETITFAAKLKIQHKSYEKRTADSIGRIVDNLILELGLSECANTMIGDDAASATLTAKRGISGGEKRRVSVALQIISNPELLCADEPTSGLDSFTAVTVMEALKNLSVSPIHRTTVICSIHQPRADIFQMFDSVLLLSKGGYTVYCGPTSGLNPYFASLGFACPVNSNPADYFLDISSIDPAEDSKFDVEKASSIIPSPSKARVRYLIRAFRKHQNRTNSTSSFSAPLAMEETSAASSPLAAVRNIPWLEQVQVLTLRSFMNTYRDPWNLIGGIAQTLLLSFIITAIFWQVPDTPAGIESLNGLLYIVATLEPYIFLLILVERYCTDSKIFDRELQDNLYSPSAYFIATNIAALPQLTLQPILYSFPVYFGCGLRPGAQYFLIFVCNNIVLTFITNGLAWWCVSMQRPFSLASLIANMNYTFLSITSGYLVNVNTIPIYVNWVQRISFLNYSFQIMMNNEFADRVLPGCPYEDDANCVQYVGNNIIAAKGFSVNNYSTTWPVLISIAIIYNLLAAILLDLVRHPVTGIVAGEYEGDDPLFQDNEFDVANKAEIVVDEAGYDLTALDLFPSDDNRPQKASVDAVEYKERAYSSIQVRNVNLFVVQQSQSTRKASNATYQSLQSGKVVLTDISVEVKPKRLVAIMGGSGSGKTTLLNLIAGRIPQACLTDDKKSSSPYQGSGLITFDDLKLDSHQLRELIGYVQQFDFHLPSLTVTETLMFHAAIRLPTSLTEADRLREVEKVLRTLGLQSCANTRVGGEELKGISGGEKRRLSIGVQLLLDPTVCLLDEPTTGLDAFTARHVVQTLYDLAHSGGRTVLLSIHQPRYDVFALFDDVILLSRSQLVWAGEKDRMLQHFHALGQPCPQFMNPGDFILDLSSVDFRSSEKESESRARLALLVREFKRGRSNTANEGSLSSPIVDEDGEGSGRFVGEKPPLLLEFKASTEPRKKEKDLLQTLPYLMWRSATNLFRQPVACSSRITQAVFFGLILSCFYAPVGNNQDYIQNRIGNLYQTTSICFIGMLGCIAIFPQERNVFLREYADGGYSLVGFLITYFLLAIPFAAFSAFSLSILMTYAIGLKPTLYALGIFTYCVFCFILVGECVGVTFCAIFMHVGLSVNIMSVVISIFSICSGFISLNMPQVVSYFADISPLKWGAYILSNVIFDNEVFTCTADQENADGECPYTTGDEVLALYGFDGGSGYFGVTFHMWILAGITATYIVLSFAIFRARAYQLSH